MNNSFWDMEATGANDSRWIWATHCPDEVSGYLHDVDWDFDQVWKMLDDSHPRLIWEA